MKIKRTMNTENNKLDNYKEAIKDIVYKYNIFFVDSERKGNECEHSWVFDYECHIKDMGIVEVHLFYHCTKCCEVEEVVKKL